MRLIKDVPINEKKKVLDSIRKLVEENSLHHTCEYLDLLEDDDQRLNWLFRVQRFYSKNKNSVTVVHLKQINDYLLLELGSSDITKGPIDIVGNIRQKFKTRKTIEKYSSLFDLSNIDELESEIEPEYYMTTKSDGKKLIENGLTFIEAPLPLHYRKRAAEDYLEEKRSLVDMCIELFPQREILIKEIPKDIRVDSKPGKRSAYPIRRLMALDYWACQKEEIFDKVGKRAKRQDVVEEFKRLKPEHFDSVPNDTIADWFDLK